MSTQENDAEKQDHEEDIFQQKLIDQVITGVLLEAEELEEENGSQKEVDHQVKREISDITQEKLFSVVQEYDAKSTPRLDTQRAEEVDRWENFLGITVCFSSLTSQQI